VPLKKFKDLNSLYDSMYNLSNLFLIFSLLMFCIYLIVPLFYGIFSISSLIYYGSWIGTGVIGRVVSQRKRKGLQMRVREYILIGLIAAFGPIVWLPYPVNAILSILGIVGLIFFYRAEEKRKEVGSHL
jgi:hypothetical protein